MLESHGYADEAGRDAYRSTLRLRELRMRSAGRMRGDTPGVAQIGRERQHLEVVEELPASLEPALEVETDDAAAILHLAFRDLVLRMTGQEGIPK